MDGVLFMRKTFFLAGLALLLAAGIGCAGLVCRQEALADKLIRFHVVANSDSAEDQALKLAVRDVLLEAVEPMAMRAQDRDQMLRDLDASLPRLRDMAEQTLRARGCADGVTVRLGKELFPTRVYDTFSLPAGTYTSLRVSIGSARGHNWWCVCFPTLCQSACTADLEAVAAGAGFSEKEIRLITEADRYEIRFKVLEWLAALRRQGAA